MTITQPMQPPVYCLDDFGKKANEVSFYIEKLSTHLIKHDFVSKPHKHDFYLILYVIKGSGIHRIDFVDYKIAAGDVFIMTPGQMHSWKLNKGTDGYIMFFTQTFYQMQWSESSLMEFPFFHSLNPDPVIRRQGKKIAAIVTELFNEFEDVQSKDVRILRTYLDLLLLKLARQYPGKKQTSVSSDSFKIRKLEELINTNYQRLKQPSDYAELMHLSSAYLNTICKVNLNKTLSQLIQERVSLEARRLLAYTDMTVNEIADQLQFTTTSHFVRYFRNIVDATPEAFRESMIRAI